MPWVITFMFLLLIFIIVSLELGSLYHGRVSSLDCKVSLEHFESLPQ